MVITLFGFGVNAELLSTAQPFGTTTAIFIIILLFFNVFELPRQHLWLLDEYNDDTRRLNLVTDYREDCATSFIITR